MSSETSNLPRIPSKLQIAPAVRRGRQAWTFSSSGWLFVYFFGVIQCLKDLKLHNNVYVIGSSGGSCAGAYLFLDASIQGTVDYIKQCAIKARSSLRHAFKIKEYVEGALDRFMPPDAGPALTGHMEVSVTKLPWFHNMRVRSFESNEKVKEAVLASSCIVPLAGFPMLIDDFGWCMDGAFSDFQILKGMFLGRKFLTMHMEDAISVCPFYMSRADIKPSRWIPPWWAMYPPEPAKIQELFELGYKDCLDWLKENGRIPYGLQEAAQATSPSNGPVLSATDTDSDSSPTADKERPLWAQLLAEAACDAPGCDQTFKQAVHGVGAWLHTGVCCLVWMLIYWELLGNTLFSAGHLVIAPIIRKGHVSEAWDNFKSLTLGSQAMTPYALFKALPAVSVWFKINDNRHRKVRKQLQRHSFVYRLSRFLLD